MCERGWGRTIISAGIKLKHSSRSISSSGRRCPNVFAKLMPVLHHSACCCHRTKRRSVMSLPSFSWFLRHQSAPIAAKCYWNDFDLDIPIDELSGFQSESRGFKSTYTTSKGGLNCWFTLVRITLAQVIIIPKILHHLLLLGSPQYLGQFYPSPMGDRNSEVPMNIIEYYNQISNRVKTTCGLEKLNR